MTNRFAINSLEQVTVAWLSDRLRNAGLLNSNEFIDQIQFTEVKETAPSYIAFLNVEYLQSCRAPQKLVLKFPKRLPANDREVFFYRYVASYMPTSPTVPSVDVAFDKNTGGYHLLLIDVSDSHMMTDYDLAPRIWHNEKMIDRLAEFHAFWWDHPYLGKEVGEFPSEDELRMYVKRVADAFGGFVDFMDDRLSTARRESLERVFDQYADLLIKRFDSKQHMTFVHRDCHAWNFLVPKTPELGEAFLIDWYTNDDAWRCYPGASDVAFFIAPFWYPERRSAYEISTLRSYHERLLVGGVQNYSWEQFWEDYRLFLISCLLHPIMESASGVTWNWYPQWENAVATCEDHTCFELLE